MTDAMLPEHQKRANALRKALEAYLNDLSMLRSERDAIIRRFMERIDKERIETLRGSIDSL